MNRQDVVRVVETARKMGQRPDLSNVNLAYGLDLSGLDLSEVDLSFADLRGANLRHTDLRKTRLVGADLRGAELTGANLRKARLNQANLAGLNLQNVEITPKQVMTAGNIEGVILPNGTPALGQSHTQANRTLRRYCSLQPAFLRLALIPHWAVFSCLSRFKAM
jgi:uncharacterized protein YjbI with pentapeptide repeats